MPHSKHAVIYYPDVPFPNTTLLSIGASGWEEKPLADVPYTLTCLASIALANNVTHLWVMDGYEYKPEKGYDEWSIKVNERHKHMQSASVWKRGTGHVNIIFPQHTAWSTVWAGITPKELLVTLSYMQQSLGIVIGGSPANTGWKLLKSLHPEWIEAISGDLREMNFTSRAGADLVWQRPLSIQEQCRKYLHKFDKGSAYPYAATQTDIGVGTPVHVENGDDARHEKGHPQAVGVWRCTIKYDGTHYDENMPPVWKEDKGSYAASEGWLAGPILRLLRSQGHEVTIHEGYVFPERHDVLTKWANFLWSKRQELTDATKYRRSKCAKLAQLGVKQIANATVGFTSYRKFEEDEDEKKRPDIRMQVVARNRELVWHNINKVRTMYGATPVLVYMDAVYYISDNPDGRAAFPELVKREGQFGGFRYEGSVEITSDVLHMFSEKMTVADRLEYLNKKGWVE